MEKDNASGTAPDAVPPTAVISHLSQSLFNICAHSLVAPGRLLAVTIIVNPSAGGITIHSKRKSIIRTIDEYERNCGGNQKRETRNALQITKGRGCAERISKEIIEQAEKDASPFNLIISAGGDGTHREVMFALYHAPAHVRSNIAILRLPMGTGNDGADSAKVADVLDLLIHPTYVDFAPAVQLTTANGGSAIEKAPLLAFNILSVGLDAFVTHMTNKMKGKMPGDSYKLWVNVAALFYDLIYKVDYIDVRALDQQNMEVLSFKEKLLLLVMGASGNRTYGSQEKILPDERNVCAVKQMSLFRKLAIKGQVTKGKHVSNKEVIILNAHRVEFLGRRTILAQMDGETIFLKKEDFPAALELTAPVIPHLKRSDLT